MKTVAVKPCMSSIVCCLAVQAIRPLGLMIRWQVVTSAVHSITQYNVCTDAVVFKAQTCCVARYVVVYSTSGC